MGGDVSDSILICDEVSHMELKDAARRRTSMAACRDVRDDEMRRKGSGSTRATRELRVSDEETALSNYLCQSYWH